MRPDEKDKTRQKAVALRYEAERDSSPRVVAKGTGIIAERIIEVAREHGIYVHEDPDMVAVLSKLDVDAAIPEGLYKAVAEVLAFVYKLNRRFGVK